MGSKASVGTTQNSKNSDENGLLDNDEELKKCIDSLAYTLKYKGQKAAQELLQGSIRQQNKTKGLLRRLSKDPEIKHLLRDWPSTNTLDSKNLQSLLP